jgi:CheY-like chemotaxis protein
MNVLVIEDDKISSFALKHIIEDLGHKVSIEENAEEAMNGIIEGKFDLVFSDIMMPGISGLSLLTILRTVHLCKTPVIAMSVLNDQSLINAAFQAGANDFLLKPFNTDALKKKLEKFENGEYTKDKGE